MRWSSQQVSGWVGTFADEPGMRVSHESIYLSLFVQARGALRRELTRHLRRGHATRRPLGHSVMNGQRISQPCPGTAQAVQGPAELTGASFTAGVTRVRDSAPIWLSPPGLPPGGLGQVGDAVLGERFGCGAPASAHHSLGD